MKTVNGIMGNAFYNASGAIIARSSIAITGIILGHILSTPDFGAYGLVQNAIGTLQIFVSLGISTVMSKEIALLKDDARGVRSHIRSGYTQVAVFGLIVFALTFILRDFISLTLLNNAELQEVVPLLGGASAITGAVAMQQGVLIGFQKSKWVLVSNAIFSSVLIPLTFFVAPVYGMVGAIWVLILATSVQAFVMLICIRRIIPLSRSYTSFTDYRLFVKSIKVFSANCIPLPVTWFGMSMLTDVNNGYLELASLGAVNIFLSAIQLVTGAATQSMIPALANGSLSAERFIRTIIMYFFIFFLLSLFVGQLGAYILVVFGQDYAHPKLLLTLGLITTILIAVSTSLTNLVYAKMSIASLFVTNVIWAVAFLLLCTSLLKFGALGIVGARMLSYMVWIVVFAIGSKAIQKLSSHAKYND